MARDIPKLTKVDDAPEGPRRPFERFGDHALGDHLICRVIPLHEIPAAAVPLPTIVKITSVTIPRVFGIAR
jgi:hypothetical protein